MKASNWIDRVKTKCGWDTDYRVAKEIGLTRAAVSNYRVGVRSTLDEEASLKVAIALEVDPVVILADQAMERAKSEASKKAWATALDKLGASCILC